MVFNATSPPRVKLSPQSPRQSHTPLLHRSRLYPLPLQAPRIRSQDVVSTLDRSYARHRSLLAHVNAQHHNLMTSAGAWAECTAIALFSFVVQPWLDLIALTFHLTKYTFKGRPPLSRRRKVSMESRKDDLVQQVQRATKQSVTIETALNEANLAKCNPQSQSPLYQLPQELRDLVFEFATTQSSDPRHPYKATAYFYRPGHTARHKTHTNLLLTCRKAWLEANALPIQQAEHAFWFQRGPYDLHDDPGWASNVRQERGRYGFFLASLTALNFENLKCVHLFMQMHQAQELSKSNTIATFFPLQQLHRGFKPKVFRITIRHTDWIKWESGEAVSLDPRWVQAVLDAPVLGGVEAFELELEVLESKKDQLDQIIEQLRQLGGKPKAADPRDMRCHTASKFVLKDPATTWQWTCSSRIDNKDWPIYSGVPTLDLHAVVITWHNERFAADDQCPLPTALLPAYQPPDMTRRLLVGPLSNASVLRNRRRRERMRRDGWSQPLDFLDKADVNWTQSVAQANKTEGAWRARFEVLMGDVVARKVVKQWKAQGSLLKLEGFHV